MRVCVLGFILLVSCRNIETPTGGDSPGGLQPPLYPLPSGAPPLDQLGMGAERNRYTPEQNCTFDNSHLHRLGLDSDRDCDGFPETRASRPRPGVIRWERDENFDGFAEWAMELEGGVTKLWRDDSFDMRYDEETTFHHPGFKVVTVRGERTTTFEPAQTQDIGDGMSLVESFRVTESQPGATTVSHTYPAIRGSRVIHLGEAPEDDMKTCFVNSIPIGVEADASSLPDNTGWVLPLSRNGGRDKRCTKEEAEAINEAMECARRRDKKCLRKVNGQLAEAVEAAMDDPSTRAVVTCGLSCPGKAAVTAWVDLGHIKFKITAFSRPLNSEEILCDNMQHETTHWTKQGNVTSGADHDSQEDVVYSCQRTCGGCRGAIDPMRDCLTCAQTVEEKKTCGIRHKTRTRIPCNDTPMVLTLGRDVACFNREDQTGPCAEKCFANTAETCDGKPFLVGHPCCPRCNDINGKKAFAFLECYPEQATTTGCDKEPPWCIPR